ncbi:hypothetical protein DFP72DRAFT_1174139 [Ephemerocybe angulata]|uniref:phytol kinase n=1 Tax=Ephemerocybe angulata TaxID=980116 RepID=A0A8H6HKP1_9AGAR|nr:hypothetical protein DFP72DRAFT_1174139 [Tulosesus angulatus]
MSIHHALSRKYRGKPLDEIVDGAYSRSVDHLRELGIRMRELYSHEMLEPILWILKEGAKIGLVETGENLVQLDPSSLAFSLVCSFGYWNFPDPSHKENAEQKLALSMNSIAYWAEYLVWYSPEALTGKKIAPVRLESLERKPGRQQEWCGAACNSLFNLIDSSELISRAAAQSDRFLKLALSFWLATVGGTPLIYPLSVRPGIYTANSTDPSTTVFGLMVSRAPSRIAELIQEGSLCSPEEFVQKTMSRMQTFGKINSLPHLSHFPDGTVENNNMEYIAFSARILMKISPDLGALFSAAHAPEQFMQYLVEINGRFMDSLWSESGTRKEETLLFLAENLSTAMQVTRMVGHTFGFHPVLHTRRLLEAGLLRLLGNCMSVCPPSYLFGSHFGDGRQSPLATIVAELTRWGLFPKVLRPLRQELAGLVALNSRAPIQAEYSEAMLDLEGSLLILDAYSRYLPKSNRAVVCDSMQHLSSSESERKTSKKYMTCSNCRSVVYCSSQCQLEDWEARHRQECRNMRIDYIQRSGEDMSYSHSTRAFYLSIIRHLYNAVMLFKGPLLSLQSRTMVVMMEPSKDIGNSACQSPHPRKGIPAGMSSVTQDPSEGLTPWDLTLVHCVESLMSFEIYFVVLLRRVGTAAALPASITFEAAIQRDLKVVGSDYEIVQAIWFFNSPTRVWLRDPRRKK